ncbi:uncharacterized protein LOC126905828 isoform X1 [Daktulosphaira vitifoliae]|uniref:uncharacterized protein LOC126905828 isoform X1 n=2 Tax=Daktulosphaira vitifoliae TaxID=58002 RepID=UPI0021AA54FE|nr:uncharacterized protein LOC126905828 isoform X1 [Daktulosphaira vitifoliae]
MIGAPNLRGPGSNGTLYNGSIKAFQCHSQGDSEATITITLVSLGIIANSVLMALIIFNKHLRRWSQGLLFHQAMVDCARAAILIPLAHSLLYCVPVKKCSLVETAFLLLVTVSTINMLTIVLNDSPVFPDDDDGDGYHVSSVPLLLDSPQCVVFGTCMIWFAAITINLGPTFMSGALSAGAEVARDRPGCPLVHGPFRHYILNALWIIINLLCVLLTLFHLRKLHRDLTKANVEAVRVAGLVTTLVNVTGGNNYSDPRYPSRRSLGAVEEHQRMRNYLLRIEREGVQKVKMFVVITAAYVIFWGPLFFVTLVQHPLSGNHSDYEVTLHVANGHSFVNAMLFLVLHKGLRQAAADACCSSMSVIGKWLTVGWSPEPYTIDSVLPGASPEPVLAAPPPPPPSSLPAYTIQQSSMRTRSMNRFPMHHRQYSRNYQDYHSSHPNLQDLSVINMSRLYNSHEYLPFRHYQHHYYNTYRETPTYSTSPE